MRDDLLLLSNSTVHGRTFLAHAIDPIRDFLAGERRVVFAPYALADRDGYTRIVAEALEEIEVEVVGLHAVEDPRAVLGSTGALFVGGGNTFRLLRALQQVGAISVVRERVRSGQLKYMGSSAGTNHACPTVRTTNDMPIAEPDGFEAFGLVPFQINPHYQDPEPGSTHMGETREQRINEFLEQNDVAVLGIREGTWLRRRGDTLTLHGAAGARLFRRGEEPAELDDGEDLSFLLSLEPRFDEGVAS
jgi:dipeptidase E